MISGVSLAATTYSAYADRGGRENARTVGQAQSPEQAAGQLTAEEQAVVDQLKQTDRKVRQHEMAHMAAGGGLVTSGASYTYERGPDGQNYAVAGEVGIDASPGRTPEETIQRAQQIRAAATAPAEPSGQDRAVAAQAAQMEQEARAELARQQFSGPEDGASDSQRQRLQTVYGAGQSTDSGPRLDTYA